MLRIIINHVSLYNSRDYWLYCGKRIVRDHTGSMSKQSVILYGCFPLCSGDCKDAFTHSAASRAEVQFAVAVINTINTLNCMHIATYRVSKMSMIHAPVYAVVVLSVVFSFISEFLCV